ncbi:unnamed protein product, partial [Staurois parvus]
MPPVMEGLDENKVGGVWYGISAASNCKLFLQMKSENMPAPVIIYSMNNGHMKSSTSFQTDKGCQQMDVDLTTVKIGHYKWKSPQGDSETIIARTDYNTFLMEYMRSQMDEIICTTVKLFGREDTLPEDRITEFKDHIKDLGLKEEEYIRFHEK